MKQLKKASCGTIGLLLAMSAFAVGCGNTTLAKPGSSTPTEVGTLTFGQPFAFNDEFIPYMDATAYTAQIWGSAFDPLLSVDQHLNFIPWLAKSWHWSRDHLTLTIQLQPNARWSDGQPITSGDVLFAMDYLASKDYNGPVIQGQYESLVDPVLGAQKIVNGQAQSLAQTGGFTKISDKTFELHFEHADAAVLWSCISGIVPLPAHVLKKVPIHDWVGASYDKKPTVVSGPYVFTRVSGTDTVQMTANPKYWKGKPHIANLVYKTVSADVAPGLLANGTVDFELGGLKPNDVSKIKQISNVHVMIEPDLVYYYLGLMETQPEFRDVRVRQAFQYAIDRVAMVKGVLKGYGTVLNGPLPSVSWAAAKPSDGLNLYPYSVDQANHLLNEAGWKLENGWRVDPVTHAKATFRLLYPLDPIRESLAVAIQQSMAKIGVRVVLDAPLDLNAFYNKVQNDPKHIQMYVAAWQLGVDPDPRGLWGSRDPMNYEHWQDTQNDSLIAKTYGVKAFNRLYRKQALIQWQLYVNRQLPLNFLFQRDNIYAINDRVHIPNHDWSVIGPLNIQEWWIQ